MGCAMSEVVTVEVPAHKSFRDLTGMEFGKLRVMSYAGTKSTSGDPYPRPIWNCVCICGSTRIVLGKNLQNKNTESCGCAKAKNGELSWVWMMCPVCESVFRRMTPSTVACSIACRNRVIATHDLSNSPEYRVWANMIDRCADQNRKEYGGRGIRVCDAWVNSFEKFISDVGFRPSDKHSIDRYPNNDGNYEPGNVRWATATEQARNRRTNIVLEFMGECRCISEWAEILSLTGNTIRYRLKCGWSVEKTLSTPSRSTVKR